MVYSYPSSFRLANKVASHISFSPQEKARCRYIYETKM